MIQHCRKTLHSRTKENRLDQIQKALWRKLEPLFSRNKKLYASKEVKENALASEGKSCRPENNNYSQSICMSWPLSVKHAAKITFAQYKCRTFQSIIYPADKNNFIGISSTLAWGKSRVGPPPPFIAKNLNSYLYMLINGRHTHCLHVPFLFHWQIYGQQPSSTSSPRDKRKKAEWTSKKQTSVDDVKNKTSILNRITIVFHHCVSLIWTFQ